MSFLGATISGAEKGLLNKLAQADSAALTHAIRLATGQTINQPSDDPAGFIQVSGLQHELTKISNSSTQVDVAGLIGAEAQLNLDLVRTQLSTIRTALLEDEERTLTASERETQQATIDAAIEEINRLSSTKGSNGERLLDGSTDYTASGLDSSQVSRLEVYTTRDTSITGSVTTAATQATLTYTGASSNVTADATFSLTGARGAATLSVTNGETLVDAAQRINDVSHQTGITAEASGDTLTFTSVEYGDDAVVSVDVTSGTFATAGTGQGSDAVVTINGKALSGNQVDGNKLTYANNGLHFTLELEAGFTGALNSITLSDDRVMQFRLSPDFSDVSTLALKSVHSYQLGGLSGTVGDLASGGSLSGLDGNTAQAIRVVDEALAQLTITEGRADAFADVTVAASANFLDSLESSINTALTESIGINEDEESILLSKNQTLSANTLAALAIVQQQQFSVLALLQQQAGFL